MIGEISAWRAGRTREGILYLVKGHKRGLSRLLESNVMGVESQRGAERLMGDGGDCVRHVSISFAPGDEISEAQMREIGRKFVERYLGYARCADIAERVQGYRRGERDLGEPEPIEIDRHGYIIVRHYDQEHEHIHIAIDCEDLIEERTYDLSERDDKVLTEGILRQLEREYGLERLQNSWEIRAELGLRGPRAEAYNVNRVGESLAAIRERLTAILEHSRDWTEYERELGRAGVGLRRVPGLVYEIEGGLLLRGRQLGERFTVRGIERHFRERIKERERGNGGWER